MIIWADGEVMAIRAEWRRAVELTATRRDTGADVRALVYTDLMAAPRIGVTFGDASSAYWPKSCGARPMRRE